MRSLQHHGARALAAAAALVGACGGEAPRAPVAEPTPVRVARVDTISAVEPVRATGTLVGRDELTLSFKVGGIVQRVLVDEGQPVRAGQLLATLDPVEIDAQVSRAASAAAQAERDLARLRALHRDSVITTAQLEAGTTGAEVARADLRMARFNRRFAQIVAPAAGVVLRRLVDRSEQVAAGAAALVVRGAGAGMVLRVGLPDRDAVRVRVGDAASVRFDAYPGDTFAGRVRRLAAAAAPGTGTYEAEIAIDAAGRALASGLVGRADVDVAAPRALPSVPVEALVEADGDSASVYVVRREAGGSVARRAPVRVAFVRDGRVVLASGPDVGAEVVTDGSAYVDDGAAVRVLPPAAVGRPQTSLVAPAGGGRRP